eukprot:2159393-Prymnesium_polylepis.2
MPVLLDSVSTSRSQAPASEGQDSRQSKLCSRRTCGTAGAHCSAPTSPTRSRPRMTAPSRQDNLAGNQAHRRSRTRTQTPANRGRPGAPDCVDAPPQSPQHWSLR